MDPEIKKRLDRQDELLERTYSSVEKTRRYFLWTLIITIATIVLPLIGLIFIIPWVISSYTSVLGL